MTFDILLEGWPKENGNGIMGLWRHRESTGSITDMEVRTDRYTGQCRSHTYCFLFSLDRWRQLYVVVSVYKILVVWTILVVHTR